MLENFHVSSEVAAAIRRRDPIVLLESTVWVHGLPEDDALKVLGDCTRIIEEEGALPVVVALSMGRIVVGARPGDIKAIIARGRCRKVNIRDIPVVLQMKQDGATTVSSTIFIASALGLPVVATGGIGGVHKGASESFDISADLHAMANHQVTVVCAGVKSVLNVGGTLEMLESLGVPVLCYKTDKFPCFYCRSSEFKAPERVEAVDEIAEIILTNRSLGGKGILVANPISDEDSINQSLVDEVTEKALMEATEMGVTGKDVTPFLLMRLHEISRGETVKANISILKANCRLAAQLSRHVFY
jgi:pseudouridine-5'-phosphate glycosidase